jgi:hypothetical protein
MPRANRLVWLFVLAAPAAWAQPATAPVPVQPAPAPASAAIPAPVLGPAAAPRPTMTGDQMLRQGREYRQEIEKTKLEIQAQVEQAKADKDVIRLNCLLDKLTQVNVNANIMDQSLHNLEQSVARMDTSGQLHEYTRITIVNQKVQVLRNEADACVGAETSYVGPTRVVVEEPPGLQEGVDQLPPVQPPITVIDRPPPASTYQ